MTKTGNRIEKVPTPVDSVEVSFHGTDGSSQGTRTFTPGVVFNYPNIALLKEAVRRQQGRLRRGTASTKTRAEVKGTNSKPWRQKGTGRARAGTRKSPLWRGGGAIFGPKPRTYDYGLPHKQRRIAIRHALLSKLLDGETRVIESFPLQGEAKASLVANILSKMEINESCLIGVDSEMDSEQVRQLVLSVRNLPNVRILSVRNFDTLSLIKHRRLILTASAFDEVQTREGDAS